MPNLRNTRIFREELLKALGVTADKDVENEGNFKSALLDALGVDHVPQDIANFEKWREKLIDAADNISEGGGGGDFSTAEVTFNLADGALVNFNVANYQIQGDSGMALGANSVFASTPNTVNVILCKGSSMLTFTRISTGYAIKSMSGDIEDVGNNNYIITGDCAITVGAE